MERKNDDFFGNILHGIKRRLRDSSNSSAKKAGLTWYKVKYLKHLPYGKPQVFNLRERKIHFNNGPELLHSLQEIFVDEIYKIQFNKPNPYIIDCGANIGLSVLYQLLRYPQARIEAYEPDRNNFSNLQKNIKEESFAHVKLVNQAIWKEETTLSFISKGTLGSKIADQVNLNSSVQVKAVRLRDLLTQKVDLLKIDIEGAEYEVINDCADVLHTVDHLFIEFHGHFAKGFELIEILNIVEKNDFAFYIREAASVYRTPFFRNSQRPDYDTQLNIFCFKKDQVDKEVRVT